jgi:TrmH family RNA methyltransferase
MSDDTPWPEYEHISSTANDTVKLLKSLDRKKDRKETGLFLAEGARHAEEALTNGWSPAYAFAAQSALERPQTRELLGRMKQAGARVVTGTEKILVTLSRKDNPQTVITAFKQRITELADFPATGARRWLALYEVRDPGNLGTIIRTADAAGCDGIILLGQTCDPFSVEAVRASMGSLFAVPIAWAGFEDFNAWRTGAGARMIAASMRGTHAHDKATFGERSVILMGNEQSGLPTDIENACDELVRIPMMGKADSLNLAIAASVMTYEAWRAAGYSGANR